MPGGVPKLPKIQPADIQAAVGWGVAAAAGAIWVVQEKKRLKNLVAKLLLSSAKFFSLSNYVSSKSLRTGKEKAQESGSKVTSIICKVLFFEQLRLLQKSPDWPEIFRDAKPVPADESSQIPMAQQDVDGEIDSSDDSMPLPPLEAYTNRLRPFGVQFDAETDSDS
ncbi:hypothetical protein F2Q69_00011412 [Brassica cretica]|uniref:Uncharacterized protein n=2 Tax=Brassica TaxID=3705 RepID=A0A8S9R3S7_BRACR|nr:hypothetical protein F2Q69_00011412 [Brassica cretica]